MKVLVFINILFCRVNYIPLVLPPLPVVFEVVEGFTSSSVHAEKVRERKETRARIVRNFFIIGLGLSCIF